MKLRTIQKGMRPTLLTVALALGISAGGVSVSHAEIYKIVDANGSVSYTDKPPRALARGATATTMKIKLHNSYKGKQAPLRQASPEQNPAEESASDFYQDLAITSPSASTSLRSNNGSVTLTARLAPTLRSGHKMRFYIDGRVVGDVTGTSMAVTDLTRGSHSVAAVVVDAEGRELKNSETISFTLQRTSQLNRPAAAGSAGGA